MNAYWKKCLLCLLLLTPLAASANAEPTVIVIKASKFLFQPAKIELKKGQTVILEFTSSDRLHGFSLPDFALQADIEPGKTTRISFTPDKAGTFVFRCSVFCGDGHEDMAGEIVVKES
jgi:cytochrome c oxidase subunit II